MLKKFFVGALIALASLGFVSISEAENYDCCDRTNQKNLCCGYQNYDGCCYDGESFCR